MSGKFLKDAAIRGLREAGAALKQKGGAEVSKRLPIWMMMMMMMLLVACVFLLEFFVVVVAVFLMM
jgi:hypothetical protein